MRRESGETDTNIKEDRRKFRFNPIKQRNFQRTVLKNGTKASILYFKTLTGNLYRLQIPSVGRVSLQFPAPEIVFIGSHGNDLDKAMVVNHLDPDKRVRRDLGDGGNKCVHVRDGMVVDLRDPREGVESVELGGRSVVDYGAKDPRRDFFELLIDCFVRHCTIALRDIVLEISRIF